MGGALSKELTERIKGIRLLIFDVDGVLTDGRIVYTDGGAEIKAFDVRDGHGIKLVMRSGIDVALITARQSSVVDHRARDLGIGLVYQGMKDKLKAFDEILEKKSLKPAEAAYVGDDIIDLPVLKRVGFSCAVSDAVEEVKGAVDYVASKPGGGGAAREICELILKAQSRWEGIVQGYLRR